MEYVSLQYELSGSIAIQPQAKFMKKTVLKLLGQATVFFSSFKTMVFDVVEYICITKVFFPFINSFSNKLTI